MTGFWKTKKGNVRISDMDNQYLMNVIRLLEKQTNTKIKQTGVPFETSVQPIYWHFLKELEDRISSKKIIGFVIRENRVYMKGL